MSAGGCSVKCGGACCRGFYIGWDLEAFRSKVREIIAWRDHDPVANVLDPWMQDHLTIADMLVPLAEEADEMPLFTCRNHDTATGLCTIYERRPAMCSGYPGYGVGGRCIFCGYEDPPAQEPVEVIA